ncbi:hypothetical protein Rsub_11871 [Raphidocelis subcapitata]|uniref:Uncharacterized protein n=1 Tax=Raphidocelis subcapitata TaxID=307507 RepID=A0A2V0P7E1_9CHLO|nr:hypothetical protein Rsub_08227 [Raphidocelis subcapitata]GBF98541.1 hypothetical protein Rsub_11871 [Raphidocelis subcapitata]|eukprot:GBF95791.1 hypothetical protein Rsub_08227 [Raphidocelis subcapitata]
MGLASYAAGVALHFVGRPAAEVLGVCTSTALCLYSAPLDTFGYYSEHRISAGRTLAEYHKALSPSKPLAPGEMMWPPTPSMVPKSAQPRAYYKQDGSSKAAPGSGGALPQQPQPQQVEGGQSKSTVAEQQAKQAPDDGACWIELAPADLTKVMRGSATLDWEAHKAQSAIRAAALRSKAAAERRAAGGPNEDLLAALAARRAAFEAQQGGGGGGGAYVVVAPAERDALLAAARLKAAAAAARIQSPSAAFVQAYYTELAAEGEEDGCEGGFGGEGAAPGEACLLGGGDDGCEEGDEPEPEWA